jgi:protein-tyrosine kinase
MEKIQQALDKARQARTAAVVTAPADESPAPAETIASESNGEYANGSRRQIQMVAARPRVLARNRVVAASLQSAAADAFRILRLQLLVRLQVREGRTVAICGANQSTGKSLVAANLAVSIAQQSNKSAVLVDLDLRRPSIHRYFGVHPEFGLSDYLLGHKGLQECLINPGIERLVVLPQAEPFRNSSELLTSARMASLARELEGLHPDGVVIFDCPPLLLTSDSLSVLDFADGCLLVVQEGKTRRADFLRAAELIGEERYLGTVFNDVRWSSASSYYG